MKSYRFFPPVVVVVDIVVLPTLVRRVLVWRTVLPDELVVFTVVLPTLETRVAVCRVGFPEMLVVLKVVFPTFVVLVVRDVVAIDIS